MFDGPRRSLALTYRLAIICFWFSFELNFFKLANILQQIIPERNMLMMLLYLAIYWTVNNLSLLNSMRLDWNHHELLNILLNKRLDKRYFESVEMSRDRRPIGSMCTPNLNRMRRNTFQSFTLILIITIVPEITGHMMLACFDGPLKIEHQTGDNATEIFDRKLNATEAENLLNCSVQTLKTRLSSVPSQDLFVQVASQSLYFLSGCCLIVALNVIQKEGLAYIILLVTAAMTDMLVHANHQQKLETNHKHSRRHAKQGPQIPVADLLVHIRDLLVTLRRAFGLEFALGFARDMSTFMAAQNLALVLNSMGFVWLACCYLVYCLVTFYRTLQTRMVFVRLHDQVEEIGDSTLR